MLLRYLFPFQTKVPFNLLKKRILENPQTIGEKILNRRLELGLFRADAANILNVCTDTITNWEKNKGEPKIQSYPQIIKFLGYFPVVIDTSDLAGKIKEYRYFNGLSQEQLASQIGVDESTIFHYENGKHMPTTKTVKKITSLLKARLHL